MNGKTRITVIMGLAVAYAAVSPVVAQTIIYVDEAATGADDGTSWPNAFNDLQDAIDVATPSNTPFIDQVWVAAGLYKRELATDSFLLEVGVAVYGGFDGTEGSTPISDTFDPREFDEDGFLINESILSGELGSVGYSDNVEIIVKSPADESYVLDGFTISGAKGHALYAPLNRNGFYFNLLIKDNVSIDYAPTVPTVMPMGANLPIGAGMFVQDAAPTITKCRFIDNELDAPGFGVDGGGAGLALHQSASRVTGCVFRGNLAYNDESGFLEGGGAFWSRKGDPTLLFCEFTNNRCIAGGGGAIFMGQANTATLYACTFSDNTLETTESSVEGGGAIYADFYVDVRSSAFYRNTVVDGSDNLDGDGGAIYGYEVIKCTNSLFVKNEAEEGGAINLRGNSEESDEMGLLNCTFAGNIADANGGAVASTSVFSDTTSIRNCIVWGNQADCATSCDDGEISQIYDLRATFSTNSIIATYSDIENFTVSGPFDDGTENIENMGDDPLFVDAANDNYRLQRCSPAIDRGDSNSFPFDNEDLDNDDDDDELLVDVDLTDRILDDPDKVDEGTGTLEYIDLGSYERGGDCETCDQLGDLNDDSEVDGLDIQPFVSCILTDRNDQDCGCVCGDYLDISPLDQGVGLEDVVPFVMCLLGDGDCPDDLEPCGGGGSPRGGLSDCNENEVYDELDIYLGTSEDCNGNGVPDECDIADETSEDVDEDGTPDECQPDCNSNSIPDSKDIADETSEDCDDNGVPDECDPDCNENETVDACETLTADCNSNAIPDECELGSNDCNDNEVPDDCELEENDCNGNNYLDDCDIGLPPPFGAPDCNENGIPDSCDIADCESDPDCDDCNENGIPDECDITNEISDDKNENGIPDECETESMMGGGGGLFASSSTSSSELSEAEKWEAYIVWCFDTDFSSMTSGQKFTAALNKRLELGLPAGQMLPE